MTAVWTGDDSAPAPGHLRVRVRAGARPVVVVPYDWQRESERRENLRANGLLSEPPVDTSDRVDAGQ